MILSQPLNDCVGRVGEPADARNVAQVRDGAQLLGGPGHRSGDRCLVGHVARHGDGPPTRLGGLRVDFGGHGLNGILGDVEAGHGRTLGGQPARRGSADARTRTR